MVGTKPRFGMGRVYLDASAEALRRGDRRVGTEHLALAMLADPDSVTARALGIDLDSARAALTRLDREALAFVGIEATLDGPVVSGRVPGRLPLTPAAKAVFTGLRAQAKGERIAIKHVLLALLTRQRPDPAAELLDVLAVDRDEIRNRLQEG